MVRYRFVPVPYLRHIPSVMAPTGTGSYIKLVEFDEIREIDKVPTYLSFTVMIWIGFDTTSALKLFTVAKIIIFTVRYHLGTDSEGM